MMQQYLQWKFGVEEESTHEDKLNKNLNNEKSPATIILLLHITIPVTGYNPTGERSSTLSILALASQYNC